MSQVSRSAVVDIDDVNELELQDFGHDPSQRKRRSTVASIKNRNRKSTHDLGLNRTYFKVKEMNREYGLRRVWSALIKVVEDRLGADATAYFSMVAWLAWMLIPSVFLVLAFLLVPQMYYRFTIQNPLGYAINNDFTWHDFFTGEGWLEKTELFEGYYTNATLGPPSYEMPIAYFVVITICYFSFFLLLAKSYAQAISERYVEHDQRHTDKHLRNAVHIQRNFFCYWNFTICNSATAAVCRANILEDMKKFLVKRDTHKRSGKQLFINIMSHIIITLLIFGVSVGIFFAATRLKHTGDFFRKFTVSIMTSVASVIVPPILSLAQLWEKYENRNFYIFVPLARNFLLQILLFFTFIFILFTRAVCFQHALPSSSFPLCKALVEQSEGVELQCWETWFGQQIYRWQIVDVFSVFVLSLIFLFLRRLLVPLGLWKAPIVNVEEMAMHLLLTQCFTWFGLFASPLLPLIFLVKLVLSFLWFRFLVTRCCQPSNEPWKSKYTTTFFRVTIAVGFILSVGSMVAVIAVLTPSKTCGPFVQYKDMIEVINHIKQGDSSNVQSIVSLVLSFFNSFGFNVFCTLCLLVLLLLMRRTAQAKDENLKLLRNTIKSLAKDKVYYTKEIKKCEIENPFYMRTTINRPQDFIKRTPSGTSIRSEDAMVVTFDPASTFNSSDGNHGVEFNALLPTNEASPNAFEADNLAFCSDGPPSEEGSVAADAASFSGILEQVFNNDAFDNSHDPALSTSYPPDAPPDYSVSDKDELLRKDSIDSNGIGSPFFADNENPPVPKEVAADYIPEIPSPDY